MNSSKSIRLVFLIILLPVLLFKSESWWEKKVAFVSDYTLPSDTLIAFASYDRLGESTRRDIWTVNPSDPSDLSQLTNTTEDDMWPIWSNDGSKIAFVRYHPYRMGGRGENASLWIINADGSPGSEQLIRQNWNVGTGSVIPQFWYSADDGDRLYYMFDPGGGRGKLYWIYIDGGSGQSHNSIYGGDSICLADISPDGKSIVFSTTSRSALYTADFNTGLGTTQVDNISTLLSSFGIVSSPRWSPNGNLISFARHPGPDKEIYVINVTNPQSPQLITSSNKNYYQSNWSPDSQWIVTSYFGITLLASDGVGAPISLLDDADYYSYADWSPILDQPSIVDAGGPYTGNEGSPVSLFEATVSNPDEDSLTYSWIVDNPTLCSFDDHNALNPNLTCSDNGAFGINLTVDDGVNDPMSDSTIVTVENVAPVVHVGVDAAIDEGGTFIQNGYFDDPGRDTWTAIVDYGDGSGPQPLTILSHPEMSFHLEFNYLDDGIYPVVVEVCDDDLGCGTASLIVKVNNVPPELGKITAPIEPIQIDTLVEASAPFTDSGADTWTALWDWGDNHSSSGTVASFVAYGTHTYETPGVYTITLTLTDDDGGKDTAVYNYVVVYDPGGGFVTGGGWIQSPLGAYNPDPTLEGKVTFSFVAKYQKGAHIPKGNIEFHFIIADLNFHSTDYDWLVVVGKQAKFKGSGTINNQGDYGFMLFARDGDLQGGNGIDRFRIKIWDKATGMLIYDNQMGASDNEIPTTELGGGSIVIHKAD